MDSESLELIHIDVFEIGVVRVIWLSLKVIKSILSFHYVFIYLIKIKIECLSGSRIVDLKEFNLISVEKILTKRVFFCYFSAIHMSKDKR